MTCFHYLHTYVLTPWSKSFLRSQVVLQLIKKFSAFYGTRRFITAFTALCTHTHTHTRARSHYLIYFLQECVREIMKLKLMAVVLINPLAPNDVFKNHHFPTTAGAWLGRAVFLLICWCTQFKNLDTMWGVSIFMLHHFKFVWNIMSVTVVYVRNIFLSH